MPRFELAIPKNTPIATPVSQIIAVGQASFSVEKIRIPKGHAYLAGLQVVAGRSALVIPTQDSNTKWIVGDDDSLEYHIHIQLDPPQYYIELRGYNLDDTYQHTFYLDFE